jgi:hypothetical protein
MKKRITKAVAPGVKNHCLGNLTLCVVGNALGRVTVVAALKSRAARGTGNAT